MPTLFSQSLSARGSRSLAHGVVSGHAKLPEGDRIHTSAIRRITEAEDHLLVETASGSAYFLMLEELDKFTDVSELPPPSELGLSPDFWDRCVPVQIHLGMFQDSVLAMELFEDESGSHRGDLRYFPEQNRMEPYLISDEIKTLLIANEGLSDVAFGHEGQKAMCQAGKNTRIAVIHHQNGCFRLQTQRLEGGS